MFYCKDGGNKEIVHIKIIENHAINKIIIKTALKRKNTFIIREMSTKN